MMRERKLRRYGKPATCYLCGHTIRSIDDAQLDHVVPASRGGVDADENRRWSHRICNQMKHDLLLSELEAQLTRMLEQIASYRRGEPMGVSLDAMLQLT